MSNASFSVDELLNDPLTRLVMQADNLDESDVRRVFEDASRAIERHGRVSKWMIAGRHVSVRFAQ